MKNVVFEFFKFLLVFEGNLDLLKSKIVYSNFRFYLKFMENLQYYKDLFYLLNYFDLVLKKMFLILVEFVKFLLIQVKKVMGLFVLFWLKNFFVKFSCLFVILYFF